MEIYVLTMPGGGKSFTSFKRGVPLQAAFMIILGVVPDDVSNVYCTCVHQRNFLPDGTGLAWTQSNE